MVFFIGRVPQTTRLPALGLPSYHVFTLEEIEDATNNFDPLNLMEEGSQGQVKHLIRTVCRITISASHAIMEGWNPPNSVLFNVNALTLLYRSIKVG